jgi:hypothetical protein
MTEPKRRGRPPKAKPCADCGQAVGHYDDCPVGITGPTHNGDTSREPEDLIRERAQAYALRVWSGQSVSAERSWRIQRVKDALAGQNLPFDGVVLP